MRTAYAASNESVAIVKDAFGVRGSNRAHCKPDMKILNFG